jgi:hypothetical protein
MLIVFCKECGRRVSEEDLSSGKARRIDEMQVICSDCSPATKSATSSSLLPKTSKVMKAQTRRITTNSVVGISTRERTGGDDERTVRQASDHKMAIYAVSAAVVFFALGVILFSGGSKSDVAQSKTDKPSHTATNRQSEVVTPPVSPPSTPVTSTPNKVSDVRSNSTPTPVAAVDSQPVPSMLSGTDNDMVNFRNDLAAGRLKEAQDFATANPNDPWTYKDKLESVARTYRSTPAGDQAAKILSDLKVPEKPKPAEPVAPKGDGTWQPIFDGKSMSSINLGGGGGWHIENGALVKEAGTDNAAQSHDEFGDGEYRFRFESTGCSSVHFRVRQSADATCAVGLNSNLLTAGVHEVIFTCAGDQVLATFDGKPITVEGNPKAGRSGRMQFNCRDGIMKILSIDQRKIAPH